MRFAAVIFSELTRGRRTVLSSVPEDQKYPGLQKQVREAFGVPADISVQGGATWSPLNSPKIKIFFLFQTEVSLECVFKEIFGPKYNSYQSKTNPSWYLALTKRGQAKFGPKTAPGQRAVGFVMK